SRFRAATRSRRGCRSPRTGSAGGSRGWWSLELGSSRGLRWPCSVQKVGIAEAYQLASLPFIGTLGGELQGFAGGTAFGGQPFPSGAAGVGLEVELRCFGCSTALVGESDDGQGFQLPALANDQFR